MYVKVLKCQMNRYGNSNVYIYNRSTTRDVEVVETTAAPDGSEVTAVRSGQGNTDERFNHYVTQASDASRDIGTKQLTASEILQQYTRQTGLSVEDVVNEYTHQVEALQHQGSCLATFFRPFGW